MAGPRTREAWKAYALCSLAYLMGSVLFYGGCNALSAGRTRLWSLHASWELDLPFVPSALWIYLSLFLLWPLQPLVLGPREIWRLTGRLFLATLLASLVFLAFPASLGFVRQLPADPLLAALYEWLFRLDHPHNLVPSLHVATSALVLLAFRSSMPRLQVLWWLWLTLIALSTLLTHQHHLLDVATGLGLALGVHGVLGKLQEPVEEKVMEHRAGS